MAKRKNKTSKKFEAACKAYEHFGREFTDFADWSQDAKVAQFQFESGQTKTKPDAANGYAIGKHLLDINLASWQEDLGTTLARMELFATYPFDFVEKYIGNPHQVTKRDAAEYLNEMAKTEKPQVVEI
jgi:hypothetical protein